MSDLLLSDNERVSLCETLDRVLNKGAVVVGEVTISVAGVDLIYLRLQLLLTSAEKMLEETTFSKLPPSVQPAN